MRCEDITEHLIFCSVVWPSYRNALPSCSTLIHELEVAYFLIFLLSYDDLIFYLLSNSSAFFDEHTDHVLTLQRHPLLLTGNIIVPGKPMIVIACVPLAQSNRRLSKSLT
jgi:hypothetical protein